MLFTGFVQTATEEVGSSGDEDEAGKRKRTGSGVSVFGHRSFFPSSQRLRRRVRWKFPAERTRIGGGSAFASDLRFELRKSSSLDFRVCCSEYARMEVFAFDYECLERFLGFLLISFGALNRVSFRIFRWWKSWFWKVNAFSPSCKIWKSRYRHFCLV
ncbi:hypothetical protein MRB53_000803 [Persea americana]|uniref:Uncharacterized protein n=1 Tax=Persea americana TaxID=3435 RepID=A0ACC2MQU6_PERAE|nr:hypothetical protein MRB53_000803 [Persea americana]